MGNKSTKNSIGGNVEGNFIGGDANKTTNTYTKQESGDNKGAISDYSEAIKIDSTYSAPYVNRGIAKRALGDDDSAMSDYNQAIRLNPEDADVYFNRGLINKERNDKKGALVDFYESARLYQNQGKKKDHKDTLYLIQELEKVGGIRRFFNELLS